MRIQHNIMAMNAYRNLGTNNSALSKNLEKLSSGYKINRAGDDAAGLAISEKMRAQIAGLDQAQSNAQSGINLVQTAEGALTEVHDMLNRMVTLATQSANGTYESTDRAKIQSEVNALVEEIDRIAENSNFNGTKLLDGSIAGYKHTQGAATANSVQSITVSGGDGTFAGDVTASITDAGVVSLTEPTGITGVKFDLVGDNISGTNGGVVTFRANVAYDNTSLTAQDASKYDGMTISVMVDKAASTGKYDTTGLTTTVAAGSGLNLQIGSTSAETITVSVNSMKAADLGISGLDISSVDNANKAIDTINAAIEKVSVQRGNLGAVQNRLEHTINNLGVMEENVQDAEANIRDTDIADEMMAYTKNNILIQSAQAMLAQANQVPQGVLQLMQ